jgi:putative heme iron utilization protein
MLIKVLVDEKRATNPQLDQQVQTFVNKSRELRVSAEAAAASKDYAQAVKLLEESTTELVRAIRNAGVYIPG